VAFNGLFVQALSAPVPPAVVDVACVLPELLRPHDAASNPNKASKMTIDR
jgi:hypothetical protein